MSAKFVQFLYWVEFHPRQKYRRCDFEMTQKQGPVQGRAQAASDSTSDLTCSGLLHSTAKFAAASITVIEMVIFSAIDFLPRR